MNEILHGIGWAIKQLQDGQRVRRRGWNGKGMFLILVPGSRITVTPGRPLASAFEVGTSLSYDAHVDIYTAQGTVVPWLCSQGDLLAIDWELAD